MSDLRNHMMRQVPVLDAMDRFVFFNSPKNAQKSIANDGVLKDRCIMKNHGKRNYIKYLHARDFDKLFKFTIVRNPWDRMVSAFHYLRAIGTDTITSDENFNDFVKTRFKKDGVKIEPHFQHQHPKVEFNGHIFVDFIGRVETLKKDWMVIADIIDAPYELPHTNKSVHKPYQNYYKDRECFEIVSEVYKRDIELLGYSYE